MLFAPRSATVIEFEHVPHVDRVFGSIAMGLGLDYWLVPQLSTSFPQNYTMTVDSAAAVLRLVKHVIAKRNLGALVQNADATVVDKRHPWHPDRLGLVPVVPFHASPFNASVPPSKLKFWQTM